MPSVRSGVCAAVDFPLYGLNDQLIQRFVPLFCFCFPPVLRAFRRPDFNFIQFGKVLFCIFLLLF